MSTGFLCNKLEIQFYQKNPANFTISPYHVFEAQSICLNLESLAFSNLPPRAHDYTCLCNSEINPDRI